MLRPHQEAGAQWLASRTTGRGYLGDLPRLGKTRTLLHAARLAGSQHTLAVCPAIVRTHWQREAEAIGFEPRLSVFSYDGIADGGNTLMKQLLRDGVDTLVPDEAHYLKHPTSIRTNQLLGRDGYAVRLPRVYPASGTPVSKNPAEFWTVLSMLFPEVALAHGIRTRSDFMGRFCDVTEVYIGRGQTRVKILPTIRNAEEFQEILDAVMLRRSPDVMPAFDWQLLRIDGKTSGVSDAIMLEIEAAIDAGMLASMQDDPRTASLRRKIGEAKAPAIAALLKERLSETSEKVAVFAYHRSVLDVLRQALTPFGLVYIDGDVTQKKRVAAMDSYQHDASVQVFLGQNRACREGITLDAASSAILVEPEFTADDNLQIGQRIANLTDGKHRVAELVTLSGTIDEAIVACNKREVQLAAKIGLGDK